MEGGGQSRPFKTSRPARKENSTAGSVRGMSTTHGHFTHHTRHNKPVFTLLPPRRFFALPLFAFSFREGWLAPPKENAEGRGEKAERTTGATIGAPLAACFRFTCHRVEVEEFPRLHLCLKCLWTGSCPLAGLFCKGSNLIITFTYAAAHIPPPPPVGPLCKLCGQSGRFYGRSRSSFMQLLRWYPNDAGLIVSPSQVVSSSF